MTKNLESSDIEQLMAEADELIQQIDSGVIKDVKEEHRLQFEKRAHKLLGRQPFILDSLNYSVKNEGLTLLFFDPPVFPDGVYVANVYLKRLGFVKSFNTLIISINHKSRFNPPPLAATYLRFFFNIFLRFNFSLIAPKVPSIMQIIANKGRISLRNKSVKERGSSSMLSITNIKITTSIPINPLLDIPPSAIYSSPFKTANITVAQ